ncbi:hypothetical protein ERJ77_23055 [Vibrio anguillarum]|nr:hypothetical protein [Vibrio anguillarum]
MAEVPDYIEQTQWIDEKRLGFRDLVLRLDGMSEDILRDQFRLMLYCFATAMMGVVFALYNCMYSVFSMMIGADIVLAAKVVSLVYWIGFLLFTVFIYIYYGYHCWIMASDRFGTAKHFISGLAKGEIEAIFPFWCYWERYKKSR